MKIDTDRLLTVRHYAEKRGVVRETVMLWIRNNRVPYIRIDGRMFIIDETDKKTKAQKP